MKRSSISTCLLIWAMTLLATTLDAQWVNHPTPGIPRLADGRPDMTAPAPRTPDGKPDLAGLWRINQSRAGADFTRDLKPKEIQPWAAALHRERMDNLLKDSPATTCLPLGPLYSVGSSPEGVKIVQTPGLIVVLSPDLTFRHVYLDGRGLEEAPSPNWMGYSVGRWEGDTLVVESNGYNDRSWLDFEGHPHSEALRVTERFRRTDFGHMDLAVTFDDPAVYARTIRIATTMQAIADTEMLEYVCAENERDRVHLVGKASDDPVVELSPEILSRYPGKYSLPNPVGPGAMAIKVALTGSELSVDHPVFGRMVLRAISETTFSAGGTLVRFVEEGGAMTLIFSAAEGDFKAVRKP
jgi:hypothetical protein